jgi:zona occludens toxin (predicted ATPase)
MDEKRKISLIEVILAILLIGGLIFLVVKSLVSAKATEKKPEIDPTDARTENHNKPAVIPLVSIPFSVPLVAEIPQPAPVSVVVPFTKDVTQIPSQTPLKKRKLISWEDMATVFRHGARSLTRKEAVAELKNLGFGKSAAYAALLENGIFADWLHFAPDGIITWSE